MGPILDSPWNTPKTHPSAASETHYSLLKPETSEEERFTGVFMSWVSELAKIPQL